MKRLNVKLAAWLVGITVFSAISVYFLHGFQEERNAEFLKIQAKTEQDAGNDLEAIKHYTQYVRHRDDPEGYKALAELSVKVAKLPGASRQDHIRAYSVLEEAIRRHPELDEARENLVDYAIMQRQYSDALDHIKTLQENGNKKPELEVKKAIIHLSSGEQEVAEKQLYELVGYDPETKQFAEDAPATANVVDAYILLERLLRTKGENAPLIDDLMLKLVERNPDLAKAHLARASYLLGTWQTVRGDTPEGKNMRDQLLVDAKQELENTTAIEAENADAILMIASIAMLEQDFDKAQSLLDKALEQNPQRAEIYLRRYQLALTQQDPKKASEELLAGIKKVENKRPLLEQLVEVQLQLRDLDAATATCNQMKQLETIPQEFISYQEARITLGRNKIIEATRALERVRPAMERLSPMYLSSVNSLLGRCYGALAMPDRQLEAYRRVLSAQPSNLGAMIGEVEALQALGRHEAAETSVGLLTEVAQSAPAQVPQILQIVVNQEMSKPVENRNWEKIDKLAAILDESGERTPQQSQLLKADLLIAQGKSDEALVILSTLRKENPKDIVVWINLAKLMAADPKYRDRLPQLIALAEKELGNVPALHGEKIKIVARRGGEGAAAELKELEEGLKAFEQPQQDALIAVLGTAYLQVGDYEDGVRCLKTVMEKEPNNLRVRVALLDMALERNDEKTANELIKELHDSKSFGTNSALYKYAYASQKLTQFTKENEGKSTSSLTAANHATLSDIRKSIDEGLAIRSEWSPLWRLRGEVDRLEGDVTSAIANYQRSLDFSESNQELTARRLVTLLYAAQRYTEANEAMRYLQGGELPDSMRRLIEDTKYKSGDIKSALDMAKKDIQKEPENPMNYVWYGNLLEQSADAENAEKAFLQATIKGPQLAMAWERLVRAQMINSKSDEAKATVERATKALGEDTLSLGRLQHRVGNVAEAEKLYQDAIAKKPDDLYVKQHLAELYLAEKQVDKAMTVLDQLIEAGGKSKQPEASKFVSWARTQKARNFAPDQDYAKTMKAVELIEQNTQENGELAPNDILTIVQILAPRLNEPPSRTKAIALMEKLRQTQNLNPSNTVALAQLYERDGKWPEARDLMLSAVSSSGDNPETTIQFAQMLYDHELFEEAHQFVNRTEEILADSFALPANPVSRGVRILKARLLAREGKTEEAAKVLEDWIPRPLPQNNLNLLLDVAMQLEGLELYSESEKLFNEYASLAGGNGKLALAGFRGRRGDLDQSFALLEQSIDSAEMIEILPLALANVRNFPEKITPEQSKQIEQWVRLGIEKSDKPERIKLLVAEMYDLQGRYDDVIKIYRDLLAQKDLQMFTRAVVENNLAFILAAVQPTPQRGAEAEKLIEDSISILGPTSDLLDTRALAYLAQGKVDLAAKDVRAAVGDRPTTSKYYHLAQVEKKLGNVNAAKEAIAKAQELHGEHNPFTPAERQGYEQLKTEMN